MTTVAVSAPLALETAVAMRCVVCRSDFPAPLVTEHAELRCANCGFVAACEDGIWRMIAPDRAAMYRRFAREYSEVRAREGRGSNDDAYYLALPFADRTGRNAWQWQIRSRTFRYFRDRVLPRIEAASAGPLAILDVGAGNGWFCYRMTLAGHVPVALDLLDNAADGLGAAQHYFSACAPFVRVHAEMDRLPFAAAQFDLVVFNAAFHYSPDYALTIREALRCLRRGGHIVILDSPFYRDARAGREMLAERRQQFLSKYGFASDSVPSREFLTPADVEQLRSIPGTEWQVLKPWYGWQWALRPWKARLARRREPAKFRMFWGRVLR